MKAVFEEPQRYLDKWLLAIRLRAETVKSYPSQFDFRRVLGLPAIAEFPQSYHPPGFLFEHDLFGGVERATRVAGHVDLRNDDFMTVPFGADRFDLIVCLGVLAHTDSPNELIGKIASLLVPGGHLILQFTDAYHISGRIKRIIRGVREFAAPPRSSVNLLSFQRVAGLLSAHGLRVVSQYRYGLPPIPGIAIIGNDAMYQLVRRMYGTCADNRNAWLGNEYICLVTRPRASGRYELASL